MLLACGLRQDGDGTAAQAPALLRHLVVPGVEVLLTLPQPLLQESRVSSSSGTTSDG